MQRNIFITFQQITLKIGNFTDFRTNLSSRVDGHLMLTGPSQELKQPWKGLLIRGKSEKEKIENGEKKEKRKKYIQAPKDQIGNIPL